MTTTRRDLIALLGSTAAVSWPLIRARNSLKGCGASAY
jgi:hypothetical protein